jgi:hypothetical protein
MNKWFTTFITLQDVVLLMVDIPILLAAAALAGAGLNVIRGVSKSSEPFSFKKASGAAIAAGLASLAAVSVFDVSVLGGPVQTVILGLLTGFGSDFALSKLNK